MYRIAASCLLLALAACSGPTAEPPVHARGTAATVDDADAGAGAARPGPARDAAPADRDGIGMRSAGPGGMPAPDWWPADIDLPQGHVIRQAGSSGPDRLLVVTVRSSGAALHHEIEQAMQAQGWTTASASQSANGAGMASFRKPGREVAAMVIPARRPDEATTITYRLRQAAP